MCERATSRLCCEAKSLTLLHWLNPRLQLAPALARSRCGPDHPGFVARIDWCPAPGAAAGAATASAGSGYPAGGGTVAVGRDPPPSPACPRGSANRIAATCTALGGGPAPGSRPGGGCSGGEVCAVLDPTQGPTCKTPCGSYDTGMSYCDPEREACMEVLSWADLAGGGQQRSAPGPGPGLGPGPGPQLLQQGSGSGSGAAVQSQAVLSAALRGGRARHVCVGRGRLGVAIVWSEDGERWLSGVGGRRVGYGAGVFVTCVGVRRVGRRGGASGGSLHGVVLSAALRVGRCGSGAGSAEQRCAAYQQPMRIQHSVNCR